MKTKLLAVAIGILMMQNVLAQDLDAARSALKDFDKYYAEQLRKYSIVGSSFVFIHDGKALDRQVHGLAHIAQNRKVDDDTIFHWASITKTLTGIAIMQLRDRGKLKLDDPITKFVPEIAKAHNPFGSMDEVTIGRLMSHSAGFRASTWPWGGGKPWHPAEPKSWSDLVTMMPYTEVEFKPGSKYSYSNPGIVFLGRAIEVISGEDFEVYMDKNVLRPLRMFNTYYDTTPPHLLRHRSHSYTYDRSGKFSEGRFDMDTGVTVSNGGLNSPLPDMIKYLNFLIGDSKKQAEYDVVLKRSSLEEMFQPVIDVLDEPKTGRDRRDHMGRSFFIEDNYGQRFIGHSGTQNNFRTHFYINPATRSGYIVAFNTFTVAAGGDPKADTPQLDEDLKNFLFEKVFSRLPKK